MKKIIYVLTATIVLAACGGGGEKSVADLIVSGDLEALRTRKTEISERQREIEQDLQMLDSAIAVKSGEEKLPLITTLTAKTEKFDHYLELQGDVQTKQNVLIYPEMPGTLQRVYVKEGQKSWQRATFGFN